VRNEKGGKKKKRAVTPDGRTGWLFIESTIKKKGAKTGNVSGKEK